MTTQRREIKRLLRLLNFARNLRLDERHTLLLWAAVCGFFGAAAALMLKEVIWLLLGLFTSGGGGVVAAFQQMPPWRRFVVPVAGSLICGIILHAGHSVVRRYRADYMEAITLGDGVVRFRSTLIRSAAAVFAIAGGESIGREGPLVQLSAYVGSAWGRLRKLPPARLRILVACGAAAGVAGIYHSPLGGAFFVAEIIIGSIAMETLGPLLVASTVSALTVQSIEGFDPIYQFPEFLPSSPGDVAAYALGGIAAGLLSLVWIRSLSFSKKVFGRLPVPLWARLTIGGIIIGLLAMRYPEVCGNGKTLVQGILADNYAVGAVALLLLLKVFATSVSFGTGAIGGVFTPSLLVGASLGSLLAAVLLAAGWSVPANQLALTTMGSFLAGATHAPVTSILMIFEMSVQYNVILPLMLSTTLAYAIARSLSRESLYSESILHGPRGVLDRSIDRICVEDLMGKGTRVETRAPFREIAKAFLASPRQELWVVDGKRYRGCLRLSQIGLFLKDGELAEAVIAIDVTDDTVPVLAPGTGITAAFDALAESGMGHLPIVDTDGNLVGEIARSDVFLTVSEITRRG